MDRSIDKVLGSPPDCDINDIARQMGAMKSICGSDDEVVTVMIDLRQPSLSRRALLGAAAATGAGLALAACGNSGGGGQGGSGGADGGALVMPQHVAFDGPTADIVGDATAGVPDGYLAFPDPPASTGQVPLGLSAPVEVLIQGRATAVPMAQNKWWQLLNSEVGSEINLTAVASTEYTAKFQTSVAGGALGDLTQIVIVPQLPKLLDKLFTDLTPYLSGDAVTKYPSLANMPPAAWQVATVDGRLWGIPQPRVPAGVVMLTHGGLMEEHGIDLMPDLADGEAFLDLCREINNPKGNVFAMGQVPQQWTLRVILESLGAPNGWRDDGGTWTSAYEAPEYERALEIVTSMYAEKLFHPNSYSDLGSSHTWFDAGTTGLFVQNFANWQDKAGRLPVQVGALTMPKWEGGGAASKHLGAPAYSAPVGLRKTDDEARIDELLRFLDYVASPFGTKEFLHINYGVEGRHWELKDGNIAVVPDAPDERPVGLNYAGSAIWRDVYIPGKDDVTKAICDYCADLVPTGTVDPSMGRYSETAVTKAPAADRKLDDLQGQIVQGRAPLSDWAGAVKEWRRDVGDAIADEYAAQG